MAHVKWNNNLSDHDVISGLKLCTWVKRVT